MNLCFGLQIGMVIFSPTPAYYPVIIQHLLLDAGLKQTFKIYN